MRLLLTAAILALVLVLALPAGLAFSDGGAGRVRVENFPELQQVAGKVEVEAPFSHAEFVRLRGEVVPPVARTDTTRLIAAGTLDTAGFTGVTLSLWGEMKGRPGREGEIGALLIPDQEPFLLALRDDQQILLPLEVAARPALDGPGVFAAQASATVGFPRYRVYLFNDTDKSADVRVFAYLAH